MISIKQGLFAFGVWVMLMIIGELILSIVDKEDYKMSIPTREEQLLHMFRDINYAYNDSTKYETLKKMVYGLTDKMYEGKGKLSNNEWIDILCDQFDISRSSAREMLHTMMVVKRKDSLKKQFNKSEVLENGKKED